MQKLKIPLFIILPFLAFGASLFHGFAPVDDSFLIVENLAIRAINWENLKHFFTTYDPELYIPLVFVSFQFNYLIGELAPFNYHLTNIIIHIMNSLLVVRILTQLSTVNNQQSTNDKEVDGGLLRAKRVDSWLIVFAGLIYAVHPLNTEAVVWLAGRKDLLSGLFFFASLTFYLDFIKGNRKAYWLSITMFLLALLSKVIAVTLLGILILHWLLIIRNKEERANSQSANLLIALRFLPYIILSAIFIAVALGGKARVIASVSFIDKILVACKSTVFYIYKFLIPTDLTIIYPLQGDISLVDMRILPSVIIAIVLIMIAIKTLKRHPWITFGIGWYLVCLAPTFLNIGKANLVFFAVDRYAYLPMVGLLIVLVYIYKSIRPIAGSIIIVVLIALSINQTNTWETPDGVFRRTLSIYPESVGARVGLATILRHQNKFEEAFEVITEGVKYMDHSLLHMNAGFVYAATGQVGDAEERFRAAIDMDPSNPEPYFSLGSLFDQTGRSDEAISFYEKAVELDDSYVIARAKLGNLYLKKNQTDLAREQFEKALEWNKFSVEANEGMRRIQDLSI
ncbi:MAG: tetratricopeptide repeat protein [Candidatus Peribacteraceae bacterium]|jgi:Tfp pilus assembly protein PilF|nr:tetratricopeptide repeat protein [Candidatus Peribacteraceae bacterium]